MQCMLIVIVYSAQSLHMHIQLVYAYTNVRLSGTPLVQVSPDNLSSTVLSKVTFVIATQRKCHIIRENGKRRCLREVITIWT